MKLPISTCGAYGLRLAVSILFLVTGSCVFAATSRIFTVADEIGVAHFGDPYLGAVAEAIAWSPDRKSFAVLTERGRLDLNCVEDTLSIYRAGEIEAFLKRPDVRHVPAPIWSIRVTADNGPVITQWRWLADSSGIAYLQRGVHGAKRLVLADLRKRSNEALSPRTGRVTSFDIRDRTHFVFTLADEGLMDQARKERSAVSIVATGRRMSDITFPVDAFPERAVWVDRSVLWAATGGRPYKVPGSNGPIILFAEGQRRLALSPDGKTAVTVIAKEDIPESWVSLYPPARPSGSRRVVAGRQDLTAFRGRDLINQYVRIDLVSGEIHTLVDAPTSLSAGWSGGGRSAVWSADGEVVMIPATFVPSAHLARPCLVAFANVLRDTVSCAEPERGLDEGYRSIVRIGFAKQGWRARAVYRNLDKKRVAVDYVPRPDGRWIPEPVDEDATSDETIELALKQGLDDPPVLLATDSRTGASRAILNPNPQLQSVDLGSTASVLRWKDRTGRDWNAGLYKPAPFVTGKRYPLVIQNHGFIDAEFRPSGLYPPFAARALAATGMVVLQVGACSIVQTPNEGPCNVEGYASAVQKLSDDGLIDPDRVGIIGFSRTCYYVMQTLVAGSPKIAAASISAGVMADYLQYMWFSAHPVVQQDFEWVTGAAPFGEGLQQWLKHSALFNIDKVDAPLMITAHGVEDLPGMWGPYAGLSRLNKPVDIVVLRNSEHIPSNPAARLATQGAIVDWFRFWLKNEIDPDPAKVEQYARWHKLREMRDAQRGSGTIH